MGCDIHCFVEKKNKQGKWEQLTGFVSDFYDKDSDYFNRESFKNSVSPIEGRNYFLFSFLAGVRSDSKEIEPVSEPKGLPEDISEGVLSEHSGWESDAHSHSYLTLQEIYKRLDGDTIIKCEGVVGLDSFKEYLEQGRPSSWSACTGGDMLSFCTNSYMKSLLEYNWTSAVDYYTLVKWDINIEEYLSDFITKSLPQLSARSEIEDKSDVRIVFWFDN